MIGPHLEQVFIMPVVQSKSAFTTDDVVLASDYNAVIAFVNGLETSITSGDSALASQLTPVRAFTLSAGAGLTLNIIGGTMRLADGITDVVCANSSLTMPDNATRFVYALTNGSFAQAAVLPANVLELGKVTTLGGVITLIQPRPRFDIRYTNAQIDAAVLAAQNAAIAAGKHVLVAEAQQTNSLALTLNTYTIIPYNSVSLGPWAGGSYVIPAGVPANTTYMAVMTFRGITSTPNIDPNVAIKLSLFVGASELQILGQGQSAEGDQTINGRWTFTASPGQEISGRAYLTRGVNVACAQNNTRVQIYRLP